MSILKTIQIQKLAKILLITFTCLTIISAISTYFAYQQPQYETRAITTCIYTHNGTYNYIAKLRPNVLYNKTILAPGEGKLYTPTIEYINITFIYTFTSTPETANKTTNYEISIELRSPEKWTKTLTPSEQQQIFQLVNILNFTLQINTMKIKELINIIDLETGTRSTTYSINIKPRIHTIANTPAGTIDETFTPELKVEFITDPELGNYITIENLNQTQPGTITKTYQIYRQEIENQRKISLIAIATTVPLLGATTWIYIRKKPLRPEQKPIEKIISPYKEIIAETPEEPPHTPVTIKVETLEDLVKISESLIKPILHTKALTVKGEKIHTFYVIDNYIKYEYQMKSSAEI